MKRSVEGDGWTTVGRGGRRSVDNRSPPEKRSDNRSSPTSSKASRGLPTSPSKSRMPGLFAEEEEEESEGGEEEEEEEEESNIKEVDTLGGVEFRVVGVGEV